MDALTLEKRLDRIVAVVLPCLVLSMLVTWPVPGASARYVSLHLGLEPVILMGQPLWHLLVRMAAAVPLGSLGWRVNLMSAGCGVAALWLYYRLARQFYRITYIGDRAVAPLVAAVIATWLAAVSVPVWIVCSRAHPLSLHILILLAIVWFLSDYAQTKRNRSIYTFGVLCGLGMVEYTTALLLSPLFGLLSLFVLFRAKTLTWQRVVRLVLSVAAGLSTCFFFVLMFLQEPQSGWAGITGFAQALRQFGAAQYRVAVHGIPQTGWLLVVMVSAVPFICCLWSAFAHPEIQDMRKGHYAFMNLALAVVGAAVLLNSPVAPWTLLGESHLLVLPYLLVALFTGYVAAYGYRFPEGIWRVRASSIRSIRIAVTLLTVLLCVVTAAHNAFVVNPRQTRPLYAFAQVLTEWLGERDLVVAQDAHSYLYRLAARERGTTLHLIEPERGLNPVYQRYLGEILHDSRLESMAEVGLSPLIKEILVNHPEIMARTAFVGNSALLSAAGYVPVPFGLCYIGVKSAGDVDLPPLVDRSLSSWTKLVSDLRKGERGGRLAGEQAESKRWYLSRLANDLGVFAQFAGRDDLASPCYRGALEANDVNLSALLNLAVLAEEGEGEVLWGRATELLQESRRPLQMQVLLFGHIRSPEAIEFMKEVWNIPDTPEPGAPVEPDPEVVELSYLYARGEYELALERTETLLKKNPNQVQTWLLRGLLANRLQRDEIWDACWEQMNLTGQEWPPFLVIEGRRRLRSGEVEEARRLFQRALRWWPRNLAVLEAMTELELAAGRTRDARIYLRRMFALDPMHGAANRMLGSMQYQDGKLDLAESSLRVAAAAMPTPTTHNNLAWVLLAQGRQEEALAEALEALRLDDRFAPALDTLAAVLIEQGRLDDADTVLTRAQAIAPDMPDLTIRRARLFHLQGKTGEARELLGALPVEEEKLSASVREELAFLWAEIGREPDLRPVHPNPSAQ